MSISVNDIAPPAGNYWKPEVGDAIAGTITYLKKAKQPSFDKTKTEESIRVDLVDDNGEAHTIILTTNTDVEGGGYPKRDARAVAAAVRAAKADALDIGGQLGMRRIEGHQTERGVANDYEAQYEAPTATAAQTDGGNVSNLLPKS